MAIITVDTLSDNPADGLTLREAIEEARLNAGHDDIVFASSLAGTLTLGESGRLVIQSGNDVSINGDTSGDGNPDITISGDGSYNHFEVQAGGTLGLQSLALVDGSNSYYLFDAFSAGSIDNSGILTIEDSIISGSVVSGGDGDDPSAIAGAILNRVGATLTLTGSHIEDVSALGYGGYGGTVYGYNGTSAAGGIVNQGTLTAQALAIRGASGTGGNGGTGGQGPEGFTGENGYDGYGGGNGGNGAGGILNTGTINSGILQITGSTGIGGGAGAGGAGGPPGPGGANPGNPGNPGSPGTGDDGILNQGTNNSTLVTNQLGTSGADTNLTISGYYHGMLGNDTLTGTAGSTLVGGAGDDVLSAGFDSILLGGLGNDRLVNTFVDSGGIFDGGAGIDTIDFSQDSLGGGIFDLNLTTININGSLFSNFENFDDFTASNTIIGSSFANIINGNGGADTISGGDGIDTIDGGEGDDTITDSNDGTVHGGAGNDTLINTYVSNGTWDGGADNDTLDTSQDFFNDNIYNLAAPSFGIFGATFSNFENIIDNNGSNTLIGSAVANILTGNGGDDVLRGGAGGDTLNGGTGVHDIADYTDSDAAVVVSLLGTAPQSGGHAQGDTLTGIEDLTGSSHGDTLIGSTAANILLGGSGDDKLRGWAGADVINGGAGAHDVADYTGSNAAVVVSLVGTAAESGGHAQGDTLIGIEDLTGSAQGDTLIGSTLDNILLGGSGDDVLRGWSGADVINGGSGTHDVADYTGSTAGVVVSLIGTAAQSGGHAQGDTLTGIEDLTGSAHGDTLIGSALANILLGGSGDDTLRGWSGADVINGGVGIRDVADYTGSNAAVVVSLLIATAQSGGHAQGDTLTGIEDLTGSALGDTLIGSALDNILLGGSGDDTLRGWSGADVINGGAGAFDVADYTGSNAAVVVSLVGGAVQTGGHAQGDTFIGIEGLTGSSQGDTLTGNSLSNTLSGAGGADILDGGGGTDALLGGSGTDRLTGGTGDDTLNGGGDADVFVYNIATLWNNDTITGWQNGLDKIDLVGAGFDFGDFSKIQDGQDTIIALITNMTHSIRLVGINATTIDATDFI